MTKGVRKDTGRSANWKGGRTVTSHGYVLLWVGKGHPLADCRGYAYEHRVIIARKLKRKLKRKEQVHHEDEQPSNNVESNLTLKSSMAVHKLAHRSAENADRLRKPGQRNPVVKCACGCGSSFRRFDTSGRPRIYVSGHNRQNNGRLK